MRLRLLHGIDAVENKRKAKKPSTGKPKEVFTAVGDDSREETNTNSSEDEGIEMTSAEDEGNHDSDEDERVPAGKK